MKKRLFAVIVYVFISVVVVIVAVYVYWWSLQAVLSLFVCLSLRQRTYFRLFFFLLCELGSGVVLIRA